MHHLLRDAVQTVDSLAQICIRNNTKLIGRRENARQHCETYDNGVVSEKREILREKNRPVHFVYASRQMLYHITVLTYLSYKSIAKL